MSKGHSRVITVKPPSRKTVKLRQYIPVDLTGVFEFAPDGVVLVLTDTTQSEYGRLKMTIRSFEQVVEAFQRAMGDGHEEH